MTRCLARLLLLVRLVVGETIQQRRLQPILGRELLRHGSARSWPDRVRAIESVRISMSGVSPASVAMMRWPRPRCVSGAISSHTVLRESAISRRRPLREPG